MIIFEGLPLNEKLYFGAYYENKFQCFGYVRINPDSIANYHNTYKFNF